MYILFLNDRLIKTTFRVMAEKIFRATEASSKFSKANEYFDRHLILNSVIDAHTQRVVVLVNQTYRDSII